jgi:hypothetical protein
MSVFENKITVGLENAEVFLTVDANILVSGSSNAYKGLKRGQYHPFGIVYNDGNGRYGTVFGDKELYSPLFGADGEIVYFRSVNKPKITITSTPPVWAETYRIAYIPYNSYTYSLVVPAVVQLTGTGIDGGNGIPTGKYFLKINQAILSLIENFPNSQISAYSWVNGDRIRQYGEQASYEILQEFTRSYTENDIAMIETGYLVDNSFTPISGTDPEKIAALEIYRPNLTPQDKSFYEIGEEYEIIDAGTDDRRHAGGTTDQLGTQGAVSTLDFGDTYLRERPTGDGDVPVIYAEDNSYSDYYISSGINIGRGVIRTESKQQTLKRTVISKNYLEDTKLNRLNVFLAGDESYTVSEIYGDITRIVERGDTLKIIQGHRETSVYIGKNYAKDAQGGDIILETDRTFGSELPYAAFTGSLYPRAVGLFDNFVYFYDSMTGDLMRSASNGTESVTKLYGMQEYFDSKSKEFRDSSEAKDAILSFESNTGTIYLSLIIGSTIETIAFTEDPKNKGFIFFVEFSNGENIPEEFAFYGDNMYSFLKGKIYSHGFGNANEFYGSARKSATMEFITNQHPEVEKSFEDMSIDSNGEWTSEMEIEANNNYPYGQNTRIFSGMFKSRNGSLVSSVPRNITNRVGDEDLQLLYSGNKMLGHAMKVSVSSVNFDKLREVKIISINQK